MDALGVCSSDRLKSRSAKRHTHTQNTLHCHRCRRTHTHNSLTLMDYSTFQANNTDIRVHIMHKCAHPHTHTLHQAMATHANTDGHRPVTSVSPSANPCETVSDPSTGHTDLPIIPLNEPIHSRSIVPQYVSMHVYPHTHFLYEDKLQIQHV